MKNTNKESNFSYLFIIKNIRNFLIIKELGFEIDRFNHFLMKKIK